MTERRAGRRRAASAALALLATGCASESIGVYQRWIGRQWAFHCDFQPSCSEFGRQSVETYGTVPGTLMTADRLMRDHDLEPEEYRRDALGRPLDPPADHALFGPRADVWEGEVARAGAAERAAQDAAEIARPPAGGAMDDDEQRRFADELFAAREDARARIEYLRLLHHRPGTRHASHCHERIALCLARGGPVHAREALAELEKMPAGAERSRAEALVLRELGRPRGALEAAEKSGDALFTGMLALEAGRADVARERFGTLPEPPRDELLARAQELEQLPAKSPWLAGTMSAVLPGAGQVYAGRVGDGIGAFLFNGLLIGGTIAAAHNDEEVTAIALGLLATGFYAGNIYGAAGAAAQHGHEQRQQFAARTRGWLRQSGLLLQIAPDGEGGAVGLYFGW